MINIPYIGTAVPTENSSLIFQNKFTVLQIGKQLKHLKAFLSHSYSYHVFLIGVITQYTG